MRNPGTEIFALRPPVVLVDQSGEVVSTFRLVRVEPPQGDVDSLQAIDVSAGQEIRLELEGKMTDWTTLVAATRLHVELLQHDWQLPVEVLPEREALFPKGN